MLGKLLRLLESAHGRPAVMSCAIMGVLVVSTAARAEQAGVNQRPNVILIMADDLGYGDLSSYGSELVRTPRLDQMASEGLRLTSFYAGCTVCTPSRMALLSGAYPPRVGWRGGVVGYGIRPSNGLAPEIVTLGEVFQQAGYRTGLIGKWHLGDSPRLHPNRQGFDATYFINKSNNQTKQLWRDNVLVEDPFDNRRLTELFIEEAKHFVRAEAGKPFFLYLPLSAPHFPAQPHPDFAGHSKNGDYGDVVEELDARVGTLLDCLDEQGLSEQTLVVFLSDNGVEPSQRKWARAGPYRGLKWSSLEGGNRVPCIVRWPARVRAGRVSDALFAAVDWYPTLVAACGIDVSALEDGTLRRDGLNQLGILVGDGPAESDREDLLYWHGWGTLQAIRMGPWKLYVDVVEQVPQSAQGPSLFHLERDPQERDDVSAAHPERVRAMLREAAAQYEDMLTNGVGLDQPPAPLEKRGGRPKWLPF